MMRKLLITTAALEMITGLILVSFPSVMALLLMGPSPVSSTGLIFARVAGIALISIAVACWVSRNESAKGLVFGMTIYNTGVIIVLIYAGIILGISGIGLWPVVLVHFVMSVWCILKLLNHQ